MYVENVIETPEGKIEFKGTLSGQELKAIVSVGLNTLMRAGALRMIEETDENTDTGHRDSA